MFQTLLRALELRRARVRTIIEISSGDEQEAGVAQPVGRRARQPYAAAPSAGFRTNVRGRSPDDVEEEESRAIKRRRVV